jgi:hypothetical protein
MAAWPELTRPVLITVLNSRAGQCQANSLVTKAVGLCVNLLLMEIGSNYRIEKAIFSLFIHS